MKHYVRIDDASFYEDNDRQTVWQANADITRPEGGSDEGTIMVALDVDGQMDIVYANLSQSGDVAALDRAILAMQKVRAGLSELYDGRNDPGRCWEQSDWGRCYGQHGHDGDHNLPSESPGRAVLGLAPATTDSDGVAS